ncbi:unnamed protein product [Polarella glacialis]|uniref:Uncharacterized protein n=1 Tax=Polarella glacialis TaxID=89957 RepID=A0A813KFM8_POLGL|nr:unnamed protein product [Polarella glacialis]
MLMVRKTCTMVSQLKTVAEFWKSCFLRMIGDQFIHKFRFRVAVICIVLWQSCAMTVDAETENSGRALSGMKKESISYDPTISFTKAWYKMGVARASVGVGRVFHVAAVDRARHVARTCGLELKERLIRGVLGMCYVYGAALSRAQSNSPLAASHVLPRTWPLAASVMSSQLEDSYATLQKAAAVQKFRTLFYGPTWLRELVEAPEIQYFYADSGAEQYVWPHVREVSRRTCSIPANHLAVMRELLEEFQGICNLNYKVRDNGEICVFEVNARVGADLACEAPRSKSRALFETLDALSRVTAAPASPVLQA